VVRHLTGILTKPSFQWWNHLDIIYFSILAMVESSRHGYLSAQSTGGQYLGTGWIPRPVASDLRLQCNEQIAASKSLTVVIAFLQGRH
jgi:hypothetical protein